MKTALLLLRVAAAALVIWWISDLFDREQFGIVITNPVMLIIPTACWQGNQILTSIRTHFLLRRIGYFTQYFNILRAHMSSLFLGSVLPGVIGVDIVKGVYLIGYDKTFSKTRIASVLLVDRLFGVGAIITWSAIFALLADSADNSTHTAVILVPAALLAIGLVGYGAMRFAVSRATLNGWPSVLVSVWSVFGDITDFRDWRYAAIVLATNFGAVLLLLIGVASVGASIYTELTGDAHFFLQLFLMSFTLLVTAVPITPFGVGIGQITAGGLYGLYGLDPSVGVTVSTVQQISLLLISVTVGGPFLVSQAKRKERAEK